MPSMARPTNALRRATSSFHIDMRLRDLTESWLIDRELNPDRVPVARALEALLLELCAGRIRVKAPESYPDGHAVVFIPNPDALKPPVSPTQPALNINFTITLNPDGSYTLTHKKDSE